MGVAVLLPVPIRVRRQRVRIARTVRRLRHHAADFHDGLLRQLRHTDPATAVPQTTGALHSGQSAADRGGPAHTAYLARDVPPLYRDRTAAREPGRSAARLLFHRMERHADGPDGRAGRRYQDDGQLVSHRSREAANREGENAGRAEEPEEPAESPFPVQHAEQYLCADSHRPDESPVRRA